MTSAILNFKFSRISFRLNQLSKQISQEIQRLTLADYRHPCLPCLFAHRHGSTECDSYTSGESPCLDLFGRGHYARPDSFMLRHS